MKKYNIVSLYSGCGGLDLGFHFEQFNTLLCIESNPVMADSLKKNKISKNVICERVEKVPSEKILGITKLKRGDLDLVLGGPPCPAFSKSRFYRKEMACGTDDPTWITVIEYFRIVKDLLPKMFVFENVHTFAAQRQKGALDYVLSSARKLGYHTKFQVLNAVDYGVPQKRERLFIVGTKRQTGFDFPDKTHGTFPEEGLFNKILIPWRTAGDVLKDLDNPRNGPHLKGHFAGGKDHENLKKIPPGENYLHLTKEKGCKTPVFKWRSRYWSFLLKLSPELPSWTIQARRSNNMGPFHWRNRILTIPEVKRLQTFPDKFILSGNVENQWRQIGNAVPPLLAQAIAKKAKIYLTIQK